MIGAVASMLYIRVPPVTCRDWCVGLAKDRPGRMNRPASDNAGIQYSKIIFVSELIRIFSLVWSVIDPASHVLQEEQVSGSCRSNVLLHQVATINHYTIRIRRYNHVKYWVSNTHLYHTVPQCSENRHTYVGLLRALQDMTILQVPKDQDKWLGCW
jgi:hypothetical protein